MFKTKLQELCHRNLWALPSYTSIRDGPEHAPRFRASVVINGLSFSSSLLCRSSKEAQNEAARLAFIHFSPPPSSTHLPKSPVSPVTAGSNPAFSGDIRELKIEDEDAIAILKTHSPSPQGLREDSSSQQKMQKPNPWKNLSSPLFSFTRTTETVPPPHHKACSVSDMVDGCCIFGREDPKEAELDAATRSRAALDLESSSLDPTGSQVDTGGCFYKKRLLELVRREGLALPSYKMMKFGASHMPTFYCSVEIDGEVFQGKGAKCKKQAENNAAQVAYTTFIEFEDSAATYHDKMKGPPQVKPGSRTILHNEQYRESGAAVPSGNAKICSHDSIPLPRASNAGMMNEDKISVSYADNLSSSPKEGSPTTFAANLPCLCFEDPNIHKDHEKDSYLLCSRVRVYSCIPDTLFPEGVTILPVCDDKWTAVSLEFPNEKGK